MQNTKTSNKKNYENSLQIEVSHKIFSLDTKSDDIDARIKSDYRTVSGNITTYDTFVFPRLIDQTIVIAGNMTFTSGKSHFDVSASNQEDIRGSFIYDLTPQNEKNQLSTSLTFDVPASVLVKYTEDMRDYAHTGHPKDLHFESVSEWIEEVTTMILEKPKSYVELN